MISLCIGSLLWGRVSHLPGKRTSFLKALMPTPALKNLQYASEIWASQAGLTTSRESAFASTTIFWILDFWRPRLPPWPSREPFHNAMCAIHQACTCWSWFLHWWLGTTCHIVDTLQVCNCTTSWRLYSNPLICWQLLLGIFRTKVIPKTIISWYFGPPRIMISPITVILAHIRCHELEYYLIPPAHGCCVMSCEWSITKSQVHYSPCQSVKTTS